MLKVTNQKSLPRLSTIPVGSILANFTSSGQRDTNAKPAASPVTQHAPAIEMASHRFMAVTFGSAT